MKHLIVIIAFIISNNLLGQVKDSCQSSVGTYNAPEIKIVDYKKINFALEKTLTENEYRVLGKGLIVISVKVDTTGNVIEVYSMDYKGIMLSKLNEELFKLNIIKYVRFEVPDLYKGLKEIKTSMIYKKPH